MLCILCIKCIIHSVHLKEEENYFLLNEIKILTTRLLLIVTAE